MTLRNRVVDVYFGNSASIVFPLDSDFPSDYDSGTDKVSWVMATSQNGEVLITKTLASGVSISGTTPTATITLAAADTEQSPARYYYHELILYRLDESVKTLVSGVVRVRPSVGSIYTPAP
jgi:hypothetical protein